MIAIAPPRSIVSDTPVRIGSSPRGVGYVFETRSTFSNGWSLPNSIGADASDRSIRGFRRFRHGADVVVLAHAGGSGGGQLRGARGIAPQLQQRAGKRAGV